ncbi:MAG: ATP-binding protein [Bullifex sp.]|nr:ATP-binding protein [Spirochaetales bacterium]MDY5778088.1 ATP-binding protein [Bullifex sp.]
MEWYDKIVGREAERKLLQRYQESEKSELVALYGRRRVGKTYLIRCTFRDEFDFSFTGMYETSKPLQLRRFAKQLGVDETPKDWFEAFDLLRDHLIALKKKTVTVFLDELPWMDTRNSHFLEAFSMFWNTWPMGTSLLKLYVCGSSTSWMLNKFIGDKGGLYGRTSRTIYLRPFTLRETGQYLTSVKNFTLTHRQILDIYMIMGGIPYYLDMLDPELSVNRNIDELFFASNAPLRAEYEFLFRSLFSNSDRYRKVVEILSQKLKGMTRKEILETLKSDGGSLSKVLEDLSACDFIRSYSAIGKKSKSCIYQLTDLFCLFHIRFVTNEREQDEHYWTNLPEGMKNAWSGYAFEQVCLHHIPQIKNKLGISGVFSNVFSWNSGPFTDDDGTKWNGGQIDLLIDRRDDVINICEIKYSSEQYVITKDYEHHMMDRISLFRHCTHTRKSLVNTFITTYGVKKNIHSTSIQKEVTMDDLFKDPEQ